MCATGTLGVLVVIACPGVGGVLDGDLTWPTSPQGHKGFTIVPLPTSVPMPLGIHGAAGWRIAAEEP